MNKINYNLACGDYKINCPLWKNWDKKECNLDKAFLLEKPNIVYLRSVLEHLQYPEECIKNIIKSNSEKIIINTPTFSPIIQHRKNMLNSNSFNFIELYYNYKKIRVKRFFNIKRLIENIRNFIESIIFDRIEIEFEKIN